MKADDVAYKILDYKLYGGGACPEQYDVFHDDEYVGYIRLRWGCLTAAIPSNIMTDIYRIGYKGGMTGCFESEADRIFYLTECCFVIQKWYEENHE